MSRIAKAHLRRECLGHSLQPTALVHEAYLRFFFFSSRRRHTRSTRDWSSDVCSSDLIAQAGSRGKVGFRTVKSILPDVVNRIDERSEERRVGKECRSRWSPYH